MGRGATWSPVGKSDMSHTETHIRHPESCWQMTAAMQTHFNQRAPTGALFMRGTRHEPTSDILQGLWQRNRAPQRLHPGLSVSPWRWHVHGFQAARLRALRPGWLSLSGGCSRGWQARLPDLQTVARGVLPMKASRVESRKRAVSSNPTMKAGIVTHDDEASAAPTPWRRGPYRCTWR